MDCKYCVTFQVKILIRSRVIVNLLKRDISVSIGPLLKQLAELSSLKFQISHKFALCNNSNVFLSRSENECFKSYDNFKVVHQCCKFPLSILLNINV